MSDETTLIAGEAGAELAGPATPVTGAERIDAIDTLRGIAVAGILVMNIQAYAMPFTAYTNPLTLGVTEWYNPGAWFFTHIFFDQRFLWIFSMLFGAGLVLMARRSFWLMVIMRINGIPCTCSRSVAGEITSGVYSCRSVTSQFA